MTDELEKVLLDYYKQIASMTDEYLYKFIEQLGGENLRGKDADYIKAYIDGKYKGITLIREPCTKIQIEELKGIYHTYVRWNDKAMLILYEDINDPTKTYFKNEPKIETIGYSKEKHN